jgi:hypothetical protein
LRRHIVETKQEKGNNMKGKWKWLFIALAALVLGILAACIGLLLFPEILGGGSPKVQLTTGTLVYTTQEDALAKGVAGTSIVPEDLQRGNIIYNDQWPTDNSGVFVQQIRLISEARTADGNSLGVVGYVLVEPITIEKKSAPRTNIPQFWESSEIVLVAAFIAWCLFCFYPLLHLVNWITADKKIVLTCSYVATCKGEEVTGGFSTELGLREDPTGAGRAQRRRFSEGTLEQELAARWRKFILKKIDTVTLTQFPSRVHSVITKLGVKEVQREVLNIISPVGYTVVFIGAPKVNLTRTQQESLETVGRERRRAKSAADAINLIHAETGVSKEILTKRWFPRRTIFLQPAGSGDGDLTELAALHQEAEE